MNIQEAARRAGLKTNDERLTEVADKASSANKTMTGAVNALAQTVAEDAGLILALCWHYLRTRPSQHTAESPRQPDRPSPTSSAAVAEPERANSRAKAMLDPTAPKTGKGTSLSRDESQAFPDRPAPVSKISKTAARTVAKTSILDTFKITDTPIGDIRVSSYERMLRNLAKRSWVSHREYTAIYLLNARRPAHSPLDARTRDVFDAATVEAVIRQATDLAIPMIPQEDRPNA